MRLNSYKNIGKKDKELSFFLVKLSGQEYFAIISNSQENSTVHLGGEGNGDVFELGDENYYCFGGFSIVSADDTNQIIEYNAIVYNYVENYIETNYGIDREDLKSEENNYRRGMALFEIEVKDIVTKNYYFFEVKIRDDYSLISIKDLSELNRKNHHKNQAD